MLNKYIVCEISGYESLISTIMSNISEINVISGLSIMELLNNIMPDA